MRIPVAVLAAVLLVASPAMSAIVLQIGEMGPDVGPLPYIFDYERHTMTVDVHLVSWGGSAEACISMLQGGMFLTGTDASRFVPLQSGFANRSSAQMEAMVSPKPWAFSSFSPSSLVNARNDGPFALFGILDDNTMTNPPLTTITPGSVVMRFKFGWYGDEPITDVSPVLTDWIMEPGSLPKAMDAGIYQFHPVIVANQGASPAWSEDFILRNAEHLDVTAARGCGVLFDSSTATVAAGGSVNYLYTYGQSAAVVNGGNSGFHIIAYDNSHIDFNGGSVKQIECFGNSTLTLAGGNVSFEVGVNDDARLTMSGGNAKFVRSRQNASIDLRGGYCADVSVGSTSQATVTGATVQYFSAAGASRTVLSAGSIYQAGLSADARMEMSGGILSFVRVFDNAQLDVCGGKLGSVYGFGNSSVTISDMAMGSVYMQNSSLSLADVVAQAEVLYGATIGANDSSTFILRNVWAQPGAFGIVASDSSTVMLRNDASCGSIAVRAMDNSRVTLYSGTYGVYGQGSASIEILGGTVTDLRMEDEATIALHGYHFMAGEGLTLTLLDTVDGAPHYSIAGTGELSGYWFGGTPFTMDITTNSTTANLLAVPEPATLALLGLGLGGMLLRRRGKGKGRGRS